MHFRFLAIPLVALASGLGVAADTIISPNMGLPVPVVGTAPGPDWANDINASLSIIDSHNHTSGQGVQVPPGGLNINSDLTFQGNNATNLKSTRFTVQGSPLSGGSDLGALYVSGVDLYYNDENGNQVRITQSGSVTGSAGTITGLPSGTASASFAGSTFTFQSATSTPALMSVGPVTIGRNTASPHTVTLTPPNALAANYSLTFPSGLPAATAFLDLDTSGNMASVVSTGTGDVVLDTSASMTTPTIAGASLSGTLSGSPTFSGSPVFSASPVFSGAPTFTGTVVGIKSGNGTPTSAATSVNGLYVSAKDAGNVLVLERTNSSTGSFEVVVANNKFEIVGNVNAGTGLTITDAATPKVGINSTAPATALDVVGAVTITGTGGNTPHGCTIRTTTGTSSATLTCSAGEIITGGGCASGGGAANVTNSYPASSTTWFCSGNIVQTVTSYGICCPI